MDFIADLAAHNRQMARMSETIGRDYSTLYGIVTDRNDPEQRGRVKVALPSKGGRFQTQWLDRSVTTDYFSPPVPAVGATVEVTFRDGDPHKGVYSGVIQNNVNPAANPDSLRLQVGNTIVYISPDSVRVSLGISTVEIQDGSIVLQAGDAIVTLVDGSLSIEGVNSVSINGKQVATLGAVDDDSDRLVSKGW